MFYNTKRHQNKNKSTVYQPLILADAPKVRAVDNAEMTNNMKNKRSSKVN